MEKKISRRRFFQKAGVWGMGASAALSGCGRIGFEPPALSDIPAPEAQGLLSRSPDSLYLPHGGGGRWFNPWWPSPNRFGAFLRWKFYYRNPHLAQKAGPPNVPRTENDGAYLAEMDGPPSITWVGHCTFVVKDGADTFVVGQAGGHRAFPWRQALG